MEDHVDAQLEKSNKELFVSVNVNRTNFLTQTETAILVEPTKSSPMESASVPLDTVLTAVESALFHADKVNLLIKEDVQFVPSTQYTKLKSTDATVPLVTTRTFSESVRNSP